MSRLSFRFTHQNEEFRMNKQTQKKKKIEYAKNTLLGIETKERRAAMTRSGKKKFKKNYEKNEENTIESRNCFLFG